MPKQIKKDDCYFISVYHGEKPKREDFEQATTRLGIAFPRMKSEFFILLTEFLIKDGFTKERLRDAVNHVIANFQYKELNISDIIQFDKKIKLYAYREVTEMVTSHKASFEDFERRVIDGTRYWILKSDL